MNTLNKGVELWCKAEEGYGFYYTQDKVNVLVYKNILVKVKLLPGILF